MSALKVYSEDLTEAVPKQPLLARRTGPLVVMFALLLIFAVLPAHALASEYGPQPTITCPTGSVTISPGQDIPSIVDANPAGTSFCIQTGTYAPSRPIMPKSNQK